MAREGPGAIGKSSGEKYVSDTIFNTEGPYFTETFLPI